MESKKYTKIMILWGYHESPMDRGDGTELDWTDRDIAFSTPLSTVRNIATEIVKADKAMLTFLESELPEGVPPAALWECVNHGFHWGAWSAPTASAYHPSWKITATAAALVEQSWGEAKLSAKDWLAAIAEGDYRTVFYSVAYQDGEIWEVDSLSADALWVAGESEEPRVASGETHEKQRS